MEVEYPVKIAVAVADQSQIALVDEKWERLGVYVLFEHSSRSGTWNGYVGKSDSRTGGVKGRVQQEVSNPPTNKEKKPLTWSRAILVCSDPDSGPKWNKGDTQWLEATLIAELKKFSSVTLYNTRDEHPGTLSRRQLRDNGNSINCILHVLRLVGKQLNREKAKPPEPPNRTTIRDLVEGDYLASGTTLVPVDKRWSTTATVTSTGHLLVNDKPHESPSPAAMAASDGKSKNGWTFWAIGSRSGKTLFDIRRERNKGANLNKAKPINRQKSGKKKPANFNVTLHDLVVSRHLPAGTELVPDSKRWTTVARVMPDGQLEVLGLKYPSATAAAKVINGNQSVNGWAFWRVKGSNKLLWTVRKEYQTTAHEGNQSNLE